MRQTFHWMLSYQVSEVTFAAGLPAATEAWSSEYNGTHQKLLLLTSLAQLTQ